MSTSRSKVEFGDFQTPLSLAQAVCARLVKFGVSPETILEPTCGVGAFVRAAAKEFPVAHIVGFEINDSYLDVLREELGRSESQTVELHRADFFDADWSRIVSFYKGRILILGNLPWVTSAALGALGSDNLPQKSNFLGHKGFDAISGKANFDISEWMLLALIRAMEGREYDVAMLLKTATARKILGFVEKQGLGVSRAAIMNIDAKREFGASVDASLLLLSLNGKNSCDPLEYEVFTSLSDDSPSRVGHRYGIMVRDLVSFDKYSHLIGSSPQKWRSGVKHDASSIMELTRTEKGLINGFGELVDIESTYLYPLMKGSDVGSNRAWREKFTLVTQTRTGEDTSHIRRDAPKTWSYLERYAKVLDSRGSSIYASGQRFSIFGIGDYAFRPWRIAICGLYKKLNFRLVGPISEKAVMFDDTVYYVSFEAEGDAMRVLEEISSDEYEGLLGAIIFWDEKRPIKSSILNKVDWAKVIRPASIG